LTNNSHAGRAPVFITDSLLRSISQIELTNPGKAVNQLEFASGILIHATVPPLLAGPMKASFVQKVGQIVDLGMQKFKRLDTERWVVETCAKLDRDAGITADGTAAPNWHSTHPALAGGRNPAPDSPEADRMAATEQAAYG